MEMCHCGKPLHYTDPAIKLFVEKYIRELGEMMKVKCNGKTYLVSRHYIALHGLKAVDLPSLGFEEIDEDA